MADNELFGNSEQLDDLISRAAVVDAIEGVDWYHQNQHGEMVHGANPDEHQAWYKAEDIYKAVESVPSAQPECEDAVPWEQLERYAEWFCAQVSYPEFVREAKAFCESTIAAMKGGNIAPSVTPKQPRWISVTERLPEGIGQVIIQTNGGAIHEVFYKGKNDYGHEVWMRLDGDIYWDDEVVAWMPLPEPWKGDTP